MEREHAIEIRLLIEHARKDALSRYLVTKAAMRGSFHAGLLGQSGPSPLAQKTLDESLRTIIESADRTERQSIAATSTAVRESSGASVASEDIEDRVHEFQGRFSKQFSNDARAVSSLFRKTQLRLQSTVVPRSDTYEQAIAAIESEDMTQYVDAAGRKWKSSHYLLTLSGQFYYGLANDLSVSQVLAAGRPTLTLDRPGHDSDGSTFRLRDLESIRDSHLHPGSRAIVF